MAERFIHDPQEFVSVAGATLVYVGLDSRTDFDLIDAHCTDHGENDRGHVLSKSVSDGRVMVVFQFWVKSLTIEAITADADHKLARTS